MKPVVQYRELFTAPKVGACMVLFPLDHYASDRVSNTKLIRTSTVVAVGENGEFETLNTQYKPLVRQPDNEQCD